MALVDGGEQWFIQAGITKDITVPATIYIGLSQSNESTLGETVTLSGINEVTGSGYSRQATTTTAWADTFTSGDWQAESPEVTFSATGTWDTALSMFLTDSPSGVGGGSYNLVIATKDLSVSRSLISGDSLKCKMTIKAQ